MNRELSERSYRVLCAVRVTLCVSGIVRAVHQSSSKLGDTPLVRLDLFESLPSRRFGCRASTTNSTAKSRSTSLYRRLTSYSPLHPPCSLRGRALESNNNGNKAHPPETTLASTWQAPPVCILLVASARAPSHPHGDQEGLGREVCHCAAAQQRLPVRRWPQRRLPQVGRSPPCLARGPGARHARFSPSASSPRAPPTCRRAARVARGPP